LLNLLVLNKLNKFPSNKDPSTLGAKKREFWNGEESSPKLGSEFFYWKEDYYYPHSFVLEYFISVLR